MNGFLHTVGNLIGRMVRALFTWAIVVGGLATLGFSVASRRMPTSGEWFLLAVITLAAGAVGVLSTLVWELSHIGQISRAIRQRHAVPTQTQYHQP